MTRSVRSISGDSLLVGELPRGCSLCTKGSKMVLFVTGLCDSSCYYCPLSKEKAGKDVIFADEMPVSDDNDMLYEIEAIGGEGAGISGGDPLCSIERTLYYISLLKTRLGDDFHIHLYTSKADAEESVLQRLRDAGLDEIRFHPQSTDWSGISSALRIGLDVGIEVPALPSNSEQLKNVARRAEEIGVSFMNINELEASETNFQRLVALGMRLRDLESASIDGSADVAREVLEWASSNLKTLSVHYCSSRFKDSIQMRNRLERRLVRTMREFEERDEDEPLLMLGIIRGRLNEKLDQAHLDTIHRILTSEFEVPARLMNVDTVRMRVEIAPWVLEQIADELKRLLPPDVTLEIGIALEYPSWDRLQTMFSPL